MDHGGFYSPEMQSKFPFVRSRFRSKLQHSDLSEHMSCVNKLQRTGWRINSRTAHFLQWAIENNVTALLKLPSTLPYEFPPSPVQGIDKADFTEQQRDSWMGWKRETAALHSEERKRFGSALGMWRIHAMVEEYRPYDQFYFVYTCDFRGRIYPVTAGLSPQGADYSKGLLQFSEGKALGADGAYWLAVSGANLYGYDKVTYDERVAFVSGELHTRILAAAGNPCDIESARFIAEADKPMQFLAFCFDYAGWWEQGDNFVSHTPVGLDGSCNGLQNFSALLRDSVGGLATNVLPSDTPRDIYAEVARVAVSGLNSVDSDRVAAARKLLGLGIDRNTTKRPVMTLPYGLTKHSAGGYISQWLRKNHAQHYTDFSEYNDAKNLLNDVVWDSIGKVVKAAREGMDWLQQVASIAAKEGSPLIWRTPTGFLVHQEDVRSTVKRVDTALSGSRIQYSIREYTDKIDVAAMKNGSSPNYIHSLDASHLVKTVMECSGINSFQMIHDDFGCHACDIPELHRAIRVAFVRMYRDVDLLDKFRREIQAGIKKELPAPPELGDLDIEQVLDSEYFFG
jgi:DNA-directed RNA polymerase